MFTDPAELEGALKCFATEVIVGSDIVPLEHIVKRHRATFQAAQIASFSCYYVREGMLAQQAREGRAATAPCSSKILAARSGMVMSGRASPERTRNFG